MLAKRPRPGEVKTRMCPPLRPEQAAEFQDALLGDVLEASAAISERLGLAPYLFVTPPEACDEMARRAPAAFRTLAQRGADLGARMGHAAEDAHARGHAPLLLRGSDSPALGEVDLRGALAAIESGADLALAPDQGGGYLLVALRRPEAGLFDHPMSTESVLEDTLRRAHQRGLRTELLAPGFDVDTADDLRLLARARTAVPPPPCPRALAWLDRMR